MPGQIGSLLFGSGFGFRVSRSSLTRGVPLSKVSVTSVFTGKVVRFSFSGSTARVP